MAITVTGTAVIVDETTGQQNNGSSGADATGNEFVFGAGGAPTLPPAFDTALANVADSVPTAGALSGYSTSTVTGVNVIDYGGATVTGAAFVNSSGGNLVGVDSGLKTTDGTKIFLYTYPDNNNVLFGVKGDDDGTPGVPGDDDPVNPFTTTTQPIVFAAYLEESATGIKLWLVQYESMFHTTPGSTLAAYDEPVSPTTDIINVALNVAQSFPLAGAPSGQHLFLMYGTPDDGNAGNGDEVALVVTAGNAASGGTVNTGQGGGGTTLGSNNQMVDAGESLVFTFVTNANPDFTVGLAEPRLDQGEAGIEANIDFGGVFASTTASFTVVQTQPSSKSSSLSIEAFTTAADDQGNFLETYDSDIHVNIVTGSVVVKNAANQVVNLAVTYDGGVANIVGLKAGYTVSYTTATPHHRVEIENTGTENTRTGADFDIGGFSLPGTSTTQLPLNALVFQDDGLSAAGTAVASSVDEDGLTVAVGGSDGNAGGVGDLSGTDNITTSGFISGIFVAGADGIISYGLSADPADIALLPTLTSKGDSVAYDVDVTGTTLTAYVNGTTAGYQSAEDREVFTLAITAGTGAYLFSLLDQLDHPTANTEDDLDLQLGSILPATDGDLDTITATAEKLVIKVDDDSPDDLTPDAISVNNAVGATNTAALGYIGNVGADEEGTVLFVGGTDGDFLKGIIQDDTPTLENLLVGASNIYLFGFGTDTLVATTSETGDITAGNTVFVMTLNPDGSVLANDLYDITIFQALANLQDVPFDDLTVAPSSGNPLTLVVNDIGGSTVDALFSGWLDVGPSADPNSTSQTTVNVATVGVGVGTGQDFNFDANGAGTTADDVSDRIQIEFLEDDGDGVLETGEAITINRFTYIMNQNNSPADDGNMLIRIYDINGDEVAITGVLINGSALTVGGSVASNDGTTVTMQDLGDGGIILNGLGGGTGGSTANNDDVTIISENGYARIDMSGIGADAAKDTFDILLKSLAVPVAQDVTFTVQAQLTDEDGDSSTAQPLEVTLVGVV